MVKLVENIFVNTLAQPTLMMVKNGIGYVRADDVGVPVLVNFIIDLRL
jgi:hypothetical protein